MRTALDRLLARPSALRVLREIIATPALPAELLLSAALPTARHALTHRRRAYASIAAVSADVEQDDYGVEDSNRVRRVISNSRKKANGTNSQKIDQRSLAIDRPTVTVRKEKPRNRTDWHSLDAQSDVVSNPEQPGRTKGTLLVDTPEYRFNILFWSRLLQFRRRVYGEKGIEDIWTGLRARKVDLPTRGAEAKILWEAFLTSQALLRDVVEYAKDLRERTGQFYEPLYETIIRTWLPVNPQFAMKWHKLLARDFPPSNGTIQRLATAATANPEALGVFRSIYLDSKERDIYDTLIIALCQKERYESAINWHFFLISHGDNPTPEMSSDPIMQHFQDIRQASSPMLDPKGRGGPVAGRHRSVYQGEQPRSGPETGEKLFSRITMNKLLGEAHSVKQKELDDNFVARLFATKAFSIPGVIKGLGIFGTEAVGPLSLREMALRAGTPQGITQSIRELKAAGMVIRRTVFTMAVEQFAVENRVELLNEILASDQHPDVLEDTATQRALFKHYITHGDLKQAHKTLAILTLFHSISTGESWNLLLQEHSQRCDLPFLSRILEDMRMHGISLSPQSINSMHDHLLPIRQPTKRQMQKPDVLSQNMYTEDPLRVLINIMRSIMESDGKVSPLRWREILRRLGMAGRVKELQRLVLWLAERYSCQIPPTSSALLPIEQKLAISGNRDPVTVPTFRLSTSHPLHPLRQLFSPVFQKALVIWGFQASLGGVAPREHDLYTSRSKRAVKLYFSRQRKNARRTAQSLEAAPQHVVRPPLTVEDPLGHMYNGPPHWTVSLTTLQQLRKHGVLVQTSTVRKAILQAMAMLYGPGVSNRKINRRVRENNPYSLKEMLKEAQTVWGVPMFEELMQDKEEQGEVDGLKSNSPTGNVESSKDGKKEP